MIHELGTAVRAKRHRESLLSIDSVLAITQSEQGRVLLGANTKGTCTNEGDIYGRHIFANND